MAESMQWHDGPVCRGDERCARAVIAWVKSHDGEAWYDPGASEFNVLAASRGLNPITQREPRIAIRTSDGLVWVKPGDTVLMGEGSFVYDREGWAGGTRCREFAVVRGRHEPADGSESVPAPLIQDEASHCATCTCGRRAPVQPVRRHNEEHGPGTISWAEHEQAWSVYSGRYGGGQSAERIAERGGFSYSELMSFLGHEPTTWRARS